MIESYKDDNRPSIQFYPDDHMREPALRSSSLGARGLWVEMLCIMFFGQPRGTLTVNRKPINGKGLAKILGFPYNEIKKLLRELEKNGVFSRLEDGTIYCRRMYNKWTKVDHISQVRAKAGKKGADKRWQKDGKNVTKMATSTSVSSSTSNSLNNDFAKSKNDKSKPQHISNLTLDVIEDASRKAKNMDPKSQAILNKKLNEIKEEHVRKTRKD